MSNLQIHPKDLTFCYQGEIHPYTGHCILQTMQAFPESRFVVASNNPIPEDVRRIVGGHCWSEPIPWNKDNLLRHMQTSYESIRMATTPYVCKIRTDCFLSSDNILKCLAQRNDQIAVCNAHSYYQHAPFFFSDFLFLGQRELVKELFKPKWWPNPQTDYHYAFWLKPNVNNPNPLYGRGCRPEQYIASRSMPGLFDHEQDLWSSAEHMSPDEKNRVVTTEPYRKFKPYSMSKDWHLNCIKHTDLASLERHFDT